MRYIACTFSQLKSINMFSMFFKSGVPRHFLWRFIAVWTQSLIVFMFMYVNVDPILQRQNAETWVFGTFSCCVPQGKYIWGLGHYQQLAWSYWSSNAALIFWRWALPRLHRMYAISFVRTAMGWEINLVKKQNTTQLRSVRSSVVISALHDDVIKWKHFPRYWPFVREIHRWQRPVTWNFDAFLDLRLNKRLSKQLGRRWFKTPSRPLWRQCNEVSTLISAHTEILMGLIALL